jgi:hypothetical protein
MLAQRVAIVSCQTRCFQRQHGSDSSSADSGQQSTEAWAFNRSSAGTAQIFVDYGNTLEAKRMSAFAQIILASLTLQPCAYLLHRRLADIYIGFTLGVDRLYLLAHRFPPRLFRSRLRAACG